MQGKILITGAGGSIGSAAVKGLLRLGAPVRAMVHHLDHQSAALQAQGADVVLGNLSDFRSVSSAMKGITRVLFIYPVMEGLLEATSYLVQAAVEEQVGFIVNISQRTSDREAPSHSAQSHWIAERMLDRCGIPVTHLQPTLFMDWLYYFLPEIKGHNRYITPFGDARFGMIDPQDIAAVAINVLMKPEKNFGEIYRLYGPVELNGTEAAAVLSEVIGRQIDYANITPEEFGEILRVNHQPDYRIKHLTAVGHMFRSGDFGGMNDNVERLTGTRPSSVKDFLTRNIAMFR